MGTETMRGEIDWCMLPEGCVANVLSLTNPREASRLSLVASTFRSAADSDAVWERFLPNDYRDLMGHAVNSSSTPPPVDFKSKKELYFYLCDHYLIIDGGFKSLSLEKWSGKKCYMLAARDLAIVWGDTPRYWRWTSLSESRFTEVVELMSVCWLEIRGKINTSMLSPNTVYAAYLVFKATTEAYGFEYQPAEGLVGISGAEVEKRMIYLHPEGAQRHQSQIIVPRRIGLFNRRLSGALGRGMPSTGESDPQFPKKRGDGWLEIELGKYVNNGGDGELEMSLMEVNGGNWKSGLIVEGIEIRPRNRDQAEGEA